jgi:3-oxoacyl-[acyl-carrier protein] reductase
MRQRRAIMKAIVCGASRGIGFAVAAALRRRGHEVLLAARSLPGLQESSGMLGGAPLLQGDLAEPRDRERLVAEGRLRLGGLDILVINSGGPPAGTFQSTPLPEYDRAYELLLRSAVHLHQLATPGFAAQGFGRFLTVSSFAAREPVPDLILSNTFRAALLGFVKTYAREMAGRGITSNLLLPGYVDTERLRELAEKRGGMGPFLQGILPQVPLGRLLDPSELGEAAAFLCSKEASGITGTALPVDGGALRGIP